MSQAELGRCLDGIHIETLEAPMTSNIRIPKAEVTGVYGALFKRFSKKMIGGATSTPSRSG